MRKKILDSLKARFEGVSETILGRIADNLAKTVTKDEEVDNAVAGVTFQQMLESYGDSRATEAHKTAVANYEKKYSLKDGVKTDDGDDAKKKAVTAKDNKEDEDMPKWAKAIVDSNKILADRLDKLDSDRTATTRKEQLSGIIGKLPESLRKGYERIDTLSYTDEEFGKLLADVTAEVEGIVKDSRSKGAVFTLPKTGKPSTAKGGVEEATEKEVKEVLDRLGLSRGNADTSKTK